MGQTSGDMRYNGSIRYLLPSFNDSTDESGCPVAADAAWSDPLPCCLTANSDTRRGTYEDGHFRMAQFEVLVEIMPFPYDRVLLERIGEEIGEYKVLSATPLTTMGRTKIIVSK